MLGPDVCYQSADTFHAILPPSSGRNASLSTVGVSVGSCLMLDVDAESMYQSSPYASFFPPALSPDTSPTSVASSPWLRTPETDPSLAVANFTPVDSLWDIVETRVQSCSMIHFIDQSGNNLEDIPSQIQDVRLEDIACTPQFISDAPFPSAFTDMPCTPLSNTPIFMISPGASTSEAQPPGQTHAPGSSPQSLFRQTQPECSLSPPLSPLTTLSLFSQSPSASPNPSLLANLSPLSPLFPPVPLPNTNEEEPKVVDSVSSTSARVVSAKLRAKRNPDHLEEDGDAPAWKISRRSKAKHVDDEEWNPGSEQVKRPKAVPSSQSTRGMTTSDESPDPVINEGSDGHSGTTQTTRTCQICGQGFTRASDYVRHIQNSANHPETRKVWRCTYCESTLGRKDALGRHIRTLHPGKEVLIAEGIPGNQFPEGQKEPSVQRMGHRKVFSRRQPRKDTRRYR